MAFASFPFAAIVDVSFLRSGPPTDGGRHIRKTIARFIPGSRGFRRMRASSNKDVVVNTLPFHVCLMRAYRSGPTLVEFVCGDCTQSKLELAAEDSDLIAVIEPDVLVEGYLCWSCGRDRRGVEAESRLTALSYARA